MESAAPDRRRSLGLPAPPGRKTCRGLSVIILRALLTALAFLTRIPTPLERIDEKDLGRALAFFPVVGFLLGGLLAAGAAALAPRVGPAVAAWSLVVFLALLTGGLHLDGLADVFDGLGGSRGDRDRMLSIMRDSRIGAHGTVALILVLLGKVVALEGMMRGRDLALLWAFPAVPRWAAVCLVGLFPYARAEGLGAPFVRGARRAPLLWATLFTAVPLGILGPSVVLPAAAAIVVALAFAIGIRRRLGGLTGDAYGAAIELSELAFLLACLHRA